MDQLDIKLDESEEVKFKLSYSGNLSDVKSEKPRVRFTIEDSNGMAMSFPTRNSDDGYVTAKIPPLQKFISEKQSYHGKLEVIFGSHYYNPITLPINFSKVFEIKVEDVVKKEEKVVASKAPFKASIEKQPVKKVQEEPIDDSILEDFLSVVEFEEKPQKEEKKPRLSFIDEKEKAPASKLPRPVVEKVVEKPVKPKEKQGSFKLKLI